MANHIELRRNVWYATLHVPPDVQLAIGKSKLFQTLKTSDKRVAEARARPLIAQWKAHIAGARGNADPFMADALMWRKEYETNPGQDVVRDFIEEETIKIKQQAGEAKAIAFYSIATGSAHPLRPLYLDWLAQLTLVPKTVGQMKSDIGQLVSHFGTVEAITTESVRDWTRLLMKDKPASQGVAAVNGYSPSSIKRIFSFANNFWRYLKDLELVPHDLDPFKVPSFAKESRVPKAKGSSVSGSSLAVRGGWVPFLPDEVVTILTSVNSKKDYQLSDLIQLAMYSGARIEELCSLKVTDCTDQAINIADSKTTAGVRSVPIHSKIEPLVKRLRDESKDGYLLSGLTFNKYGDRSNAIGKRFGRLKQSLGFSEKQVFHSIRKTVTTMLENAGISENLAADIVGHEKPRITYGLYSGGHSLEAMKEAIEKVIYPGRE